MPEFQFVTDIPASIDKVWAFHNTIDSLFLLTPPDKHAKLIGESSPMCKGVIYKIQVKQFGLIPIQLWSEIIEYSPPNGFKDIQVKGHGPFSYWTHTHLFTAVSGNLTRITDSIQYELPFGIVGKWADRLVVAKDIEKMFQYRHKVTLNKLSS